MTPHAQATQRPWKTLYRKGPQYPLNGWIIYDCSDIERPIGVVPETIGGNKDKMGRSPNQTANAALIVAAVNSHDKLVEALNGCRRLAMAWVQDAKNEGDAVEQAAANQELQRIEAALKEAGR